MSRLARLPAVLGPGTLAVVMVRGPHDTARREGLPIAQPDDLRAGERSASHADDRHGKWRRAVAVSVSLAWCALVGVVGCEHDGTPAETLELPSHRPWEYGVSFVIEWEDTAGLSSARFESPSPGSFRITVSTLVGVFAVGDRERTLGVGLPRATMHQYFAVDDAMLLLSDPAMLERLTIERVWLDGDLTCASVTGSPEPTRVTEVCLRRTPPLVGMIERVTTAPVDGGPAYRLRVHPDSVREHVALDAALFRMEPPAGSTDTTAEADRRWIGGAAP